MNGWIKLDEKFEIKKFCENLGLDIVGFTKCRKFNELHSHYKDLKAKGMLNEFEEKDIEAKINPFKMMKEGKTIISIAFPYIFSKEKNKDIYFSKYTLGLDYHKVLKKYLQKICDFIIKDLGGQAKCFVDSNPLPERYIAYLTGVGFIGKNNMLITEKYGSYVFLGEIITDLGIEEDKPKESLCGKCSICLEACPTKSLIRNNSNICLSYITQKKEIEDKWFSKLQGRLFGCDTCQEMCHYNKDIKMSCIKELKPLPYMKNIDMDEILELNGATFRGKYKATSCGWRGKNVIIRNMLINKYYFGMLHDNCKIQFKSTYINNYYNRLLNNSNL